MSITITINATDALDARQQMTALLHGPCMPTAAVPEHWSASGEPLPGNPLLHSAASPMTATEVLQRQEPAKRSPGRPRKAPVPEAPTQGGTPGIVSAPQETVSNGPSSTPSALPPAEAAPTTAPPAAEPVGADGVKKIDFDTMKAALQKVAIKRAGDADDNAGLIRASAIIGKFGYRKIKEVNEEHFAGVYEECVRDLAAAGVA